MTGKTHGFGFAAQLIVLLFSLFLLASFSWAGEDIEVNVESSNGVPLSNLNVYAFTESGSYTGVNATTDEEGPAIFNTDSFDAGTYKFRVDYLGNQFWSQVITLPDTLSVDVIIEEETAEVTVTASSGPSQGVKVYLFSGTGSYLGLYETTDEYGKVSFDLPVDRDFKFRADILGSQYWSDIVTIVSGGINDVSVDAGGGTLYVTVDKGAGIPMEGINTYLFNTAGSYLGLSQASNASGMVEYDVPQRDYKVRADYLGNQFWSQDTPVTEDTEITISIPHQEVVITVEGTYQTIPDPIEGINVYLFSSSGSYMEQYELTDGSGQVTFNLPEQSYKVRADYMGQQFWSGDFTWQDTTVDIPMADAEITVTGAGLPLEDVNVYVFSESGSYLGIYGTTDVDGIVTFRLPAGTYNFRADYQGSQYWSDAETLTEDQSNPVDISTGGGVFTLTVFKGSADPLTGVNCYLFSESGSYLGLYDTTDTNGQVSFSLADGTFKIRVDYLGNQFWTDLYEIPTTLSDDFTIPHQDVAIMIQGAYQGAEDPLEGINIYLFSSSGSYMGQYEVTDGSGQVTFNLPEQSYKVRADYMGQQFWSGDFTWQDTTVTIQQGIAQIHVFRGDADVAGASVYLFSEAGSYLGWYETTNTSGMVQFLVPSDPYKFRADEGGDQIWSDVVTIIADQVNSVDLNLSDEPTVTLTADPETITAGDSSTLTWISTNADTVSIDQGIGSVDLNGSMTVSPSETITYTITAEGPGGTATDTATVTLSMAPEDVDLGLAFDEQQGGGGLVGETIRILNGNTIESRTDLQFSSPNSLGLILEAYYNSRSDITGSMGYGWSHTYELTLDPSFDLSGITLLKIIDNTGRAHYFMEQETGEYYGVFAEKSRVTLDSGEYTWYRLDGSQYGFSSTGQLLWIDDAVGNTLVLAYDNDLLETVTDSASGRVLTFSYNVDDLLDYITGPETDAVADGIWVEYGYDGNDNLTSVTYADNSGFNYYYTDSNDIQNLTEKENLAGHLINEWDYDTSDRADTNFSREGKGVEIVYTSTTQINVTDAYGEERIYYLYDDITGRKRVSDISDGDSAGLAPYSSSTAVEWDYDSNMNVTRIGYAGGTDNLYQDYDVRGNPGTVILAYQEDEERTITYTYHPDMNTPLTRTEESVFSGTGSKETIWDYDDDYNSTPNEAPTALLSRIVEKGYTKDETQTTVSYEYITTYTYNGKGQVLSIDGPLTGAGDTTYFSYDSVTGDLETITRPLIGDTTFSGYDDAGQVGTVTDVNNRSKSYAYDGRGRVTVITNNADSSTSSVSYNIAGDQESRTDEDSVTSSFEYESVYGRLSFQYDHQGNYIEYTYDDQGNVVEKEYYDSEDTLTNRKRFLYQHENHDKPGLLYREINADDTYIEYGYDLEGNVDSVTDPNENTTTYAYDPLNRLETVTQPGSIVTTYAYDSHGNLNSVTDAESHETTYQYDDMGRLVSTTSPDTGTVTYVYDAAGNPVNKTDAEEISVDYTYDVLNRLTDIEFPDSSQDISYTYDEGTDGMGQRTGMEDESGDHTFSYDSRGRLTGKTYVINSIEYELSRVYTPGGRIDYIEYPSGRTVDYDRSTCACRVDAITTTYNSNTETLMDNLTYRPFGGASGMDTGADGTIGSEFDLSGRLITSNPEATHERTYTYYNNGNLHTVSAPSLPRYDREYVYDALNRLTGATAEDAWGDIDYTYDDVGNRLTRITDTVTETYTYVTGTNILEEVETDTETITYTYDANGNITGIGDMELTYNQNNRLVMVEEDSVTLGEYTYNGLGQRIIKEVDEVITVFHYDFDGNIIAESDDSGNFDKEYLYRGSSRLALVDVSGEEIYYYGNDQLGTPQILTDSTNTVVWEAVYKPFGEAEVNSNSTVENNFRFPGQYYDQETGLHYNYHRYYDPQTGRYLSADPIGIEEGKNHLFVYAKNNPINRTDPEGLYSDECEEDEPWKECLNAPPLPSNSEECNKYGTDRYPTPLGTSLKCFCKCAGDCPWSNKVRGCLRCMEENGVGRIKSHIECYNAADKAGLNRPNLRLIYCFAYCEFRNDYP